MPRVLLGVVRTEVLLYKRDKATMVKHYGQGWSGIIRELVEDHCNVIRRSTTIDATLTAGDFEDE